MTRHTEFWQLLRINTEKAMREEGGPRIRLRGGPADGWMVLDHAEFMSKDWYENAPESMKEEMGPPGRYILVDVMERDARVAVWIED